MSFVFATGKGQIFTLDFLDIGVSSLCSKMESSVNWHVSFGHGLTSNLSVSLLLMLSIVSLLLIFPRITVSSLFFVTVSKYHFHGTILEFSIYSWWHDFLISFNWSFIFLFWAIFIVFSFLTYFIEAFLLSMGILKSWHCRGELWSKLCRLWGGCLLNPPIISLCEGVFEKLIKMWSSNNLFKSLNFCIKFLQKVVNLKFFSILHQTF